MPFGVLNCPWSSTGSANLTSTRGLGGLPSSLLRHGIGGQGCGILSGFKLILIVLGSLNCCHCLLCSKGIVKIGMHLSSHFTRYFAYLSESKSLGLHSLGSIWQVTLFYLMCSGDTVFTLLWDLRLGFLCCYYWSLTCLCSEVVMLFRYRCSLKLESVFYPWLSTVPLTSLDPESLSHLKTCP